MSLRPNGAPALLLLSLWDAQGRGERAVPVQPCTARVRLLELEFVREGEASGLILTASGQQAAQTLEAGK